MSSQNASQCSITASSQDGWNIAGIVSDLHRLREESLVKRLRAVKPIKLPSREALGRLVEQLGAVLFPNRLGTPELAPESVDYFVGHTLNLALRELVYQVQRELRFVALNSKTDTASDTELYDRACQIVKQFSCTLPAIREILDTDLQAAYEGDPAAQRRRGAGLLPRDRRDYSPPHRPPALQARCHPCRSHHRRDRSLEHWHRHSSRRDHQSQLLHRPRDGRRDRGNGHYRRASPPVSRSDSGSQVVPRRRERSPDEG